MSPAGYLVRDSFLSLHNGSPAAVPHSRHVRHLRLIHVERFYADTTSYSLRIYPFGSPLEYMHYPSITSASSCSRSKSNTRSYALCAFLVPLIGAPMRIHSRINSGSSSSLGCPVLHRYQCANSCLSIDLYSTSPSRSLTRWFSRISQIPSSGSFVYRKLAFIRFHSRSTHTMGHVISTPQYLRATDSASSR